MVYAMDKWRVNFSAKPYPKEMQHGNTWFVDGRLYTYRNLLPVTRDYLSDTATKEREELTDQNTTSRDKLLEKKVGKMKFKEISKFPSVKKDLAVIVDKDKTSGEVSMAIKKAASNLLTKVELFDVYTGANIDENKKSLAYSLTFEDSKKTLTDEEINKEMEKIIEFLNKKINAELRK